MRGAPRATAVIGACFGDEGKGLMTDHLSEVCTLVVRHNGGGQAGHTVNRNGIRHVFRHHGSGTLRGADTFLAREFIVNPLLWRDERRELDEAGVRPRVYVDPTARLTVPQDIAINQFSERIRGRHKHGSCGSGINETMQRCMGRGGLYVANLASEGWQKRLVEKLQEISGVWVPKRLDKLGLDPKEFREFYYGRDWEPEYVRACEEFRDTVIMMNAASALRSHHDRVVFEGAQGLLLDQDHEFYPFVTHSKTGTTNVFPIMKDMGLVDLKVIYVSRCYMTRHGTGPFPTEDERLYFEDQTNVQNTYQGPLRFGDMDYKLIARGIFKDIKVPRSGVFKVEHEIALTHADQVWFPTVAVNMLQTTGLLVKHVAFGPKDEDIREWNDRSQVHKASLPNVH